MLEELKIKILNSIDLNNDLISSLVTAIRYDGSDIVNRGNEEDPNLYCLGLSFDIYLKDRVEESKYDIIVDFLQKSILSNKDIISKVEKHDALNCMYRNYMESGKTKICFLVYLKLPKKVNELDIKMIEMLKEHLNKTKAHLDINLTMAETNLVKTNIDYFGVGVNDMLFYVKDTKLSILECEILKNIMLNVTALIGLYKYKLIDLDKKEDGYNCYAIVYEDSNIFDSYDVTKEFITGNKHA